jgi:hypothetical protein
MSAIRKLSVPAALVLAVVSSGCEDHPPAEKVTACAAQRIGSEFGTFSWKALSGSQELITYQQRGGPDRAVITYDRRHGPVTVHQEISFGNHAEIKSAVEAVRYCTWAAAKEQEPAP